jgi:3-phenylpropionate/trans-cinnamate dioxygenase ferredoxin component
VWPSNEVVDRLEFFADMHDRREETRGAAKGFERFELSAGETPRPAPLETVKVKRLCTRVRVGDIRDLVLGELHRFDVESRRILVVNLGEKIVACDDTGSHKGASLVEMGELDLGSREIECCQHGARFSLEDGCALSLPATTGLCTYEVTTVGDDVFVEVPS